MKWIDFIVLAEDEGIEVGSVLDTIEKVGNHYDICFTDSDGSQHVIIVEE